MALSWKKLSAYAKSPQGKKLLAQAKQLDTPQNREKAKELVTELRKRAAPAAKKAVPAAKAAAAKVTDRKKVPAPKPPSGPEAPAT